ncbi:conserved hypothetical protein, partial [delta proteobacterium NaphS2]
MGVCVDFTVFSVQEDVIVEAYAMNAAAISAHEPNCCIFLGLPA